MDSRDNPASPFISRDEAEVWAAEHMGVNLDEQRIKQNAAEIEFVDQFVGVHFDMHDDPVLARTVAFCKDAMRTMYASAQEIRDVLPDLDSTDLGPRLSLVEHELRERVPPWYGTDPPSRGG